MYSQRQLCNLNVHNLEAPATRCSTAINVLQYNCSEPVFNIRDNYLISLFLVKLLAALKTLLKIELLIEN